MPKTSRPAPIAFASRVHLVPIRLMKRPAFLQKEFKESRAQHIADTLDLDGLGRIVVNHRDGVYWIIDGCHRHYALVQNDFSAYDIECEVYEGLSDEQMAKVFLLHANRRLMGAFEKFNVQCEAGTAREAEIKRTVEAAGLKISRAKDPGCLSAVSALVRVHDLAGVEAVARVLQIVRDAWGNAPGSFEGQVIYGLGLVVNRYNGSVSTSHLTTSLAAVPNGVRGVLQRAEAQRDRTGNPKSMCVAAAIVDIYNRRRTKGARTLLSWWKSEAEALAAAAAAPRKEARRG